MIFLLKNWRLCLALLAILGSLAGLAYTYQKGRIDKARDIERREMIEHIKAGEILNEIRNRPDDLNTVIDRLRSGKF